MFFTSHWHCFAYIFYCIHSPIDHFHHISFIDLSLTSSQTIKSFYTLRLHFSFHPTSCHACSIIWFSIVPNNLSFTLYLYQIAPTLLTVRTKKITHCDSTGGLSAHKHQPWRIVCLQRIIMTASKFAQKLSIFKRSSSFSSRTSNDMNLKS